MHAKKWWAMALGAGGVAATCGAAPPARIDVSSSAVSSQPAEADSDAPPFEQRMLDREGRPLRFKFRIHPDAFAWGGAVAVGEPVRSPFGNPADAPQEAGTPWIGVQLGPIPAALAAHLQTGEKGLIVRNVFKGSPADAAGLQRHDVIVRLGDNEVAPSVESFSKSVREHKVNDTIHLTLIRGGKELSLDLKLVEAPPPDELAPKFADEPDVLYKRDFGLRGRILRQGPNGWEMQDLGELPDLEPLFRDMPRERRSSPRPGRELRPEAAPDHARRVGRNGQTIDVRRQKDGSIEVRRERRSTTQPSGDDRSVEVTVFPNAAELRKGDSEAAALLEVQAAPPRPPAPPVGPTPPGGRMERRNVNPPDRPQPPSARPRPPEGGMQRGPITPQDDRWSEWRERFFRGPFERPQQDERAPAQTGQPAVRFEKQPDGRITVHKREGDAEISVTFTNRDDFHARAPELFRQFETLEQSLK